MIEIPLICSYTSKVSLEKEVQISKEDSKPSLQLVWSTFASQEQAKPIVEILVKEQLAVCAWMSPEGGVSMYEWQGECCAEAEIGVIFKIIPDQQVWFESRLRDCGKSNNNKFLR